MARKRRRFDASDDDSQDSDYEVSSQKKKLKAATKKAQTPKLKAEIIIRATDIAVDEAAARDRLRQVDSTVLERIKKALALGHHQATSEQEARAALRMATKLLDKHNVTQADILAQETDEDKLKRAGTSVISIRCISEPPITVNVEGWSSKLAYAMTIFFDCQYYNTAFDERVDWSFYGLAEQTVTAALAFEMTYNLILSWSLKLSVGDGHHRHKKNCYRTGVVDDLVSMAKHEKKEEKKQAYHREEALLQSRRDAEKVDELGQIERLTGPAGGEDMNDEVGDLKAASHDNRVKIEEVEDEDTKYNPHNNAPKNESSPFKRMTPKQEDGPDNWQYVPQAPGDSLDEMSDNDDLPEVGDSDDLAKLDILPVDFHDNDDVDDLLDLDAIRPGIKELFPGVMGPPTSTVPLTGPKAIKKSADDDSQWNSVCQLVTFRETSVAIAEDYLKSQGIKLHSSRRSTFTIQTEAGRQLYQKGKDDAKRINVRRKPLKNREDD